MVEDILNEYLRLDYGGLGLIWYNLYISVIFQGIYMCSMSNERIFFLLLCNVKVPSIRLIYQKI